MGERLHRKLRQLGLVGLSTDQGTYGQTAGLQSYEVGGELKGVI